MFYLEAKYASRLYVSHIIQVIKLSIWFTSWFVEDARQPTPSVPYMIKPLDIPATFCKLPAIATPSPGVWVDGVDGWELEGPSVFPVPVLLAGPEDVGPFLFRLF